MDRIGLTRIQMLEQNLLSCQLLILTKKVSDGRTNNVSYRAVELVIHDMNSSSFTTILGSAVDWSVPDNINGTV